LLQKAIENAQKLGFTDGATLLPMVTMTKNATTDKIAAREIHQETRLLALQFSSYIRYTGGC